jgi:ribonuclease VapC
MVTQAVVDASALIAYARQEPGRDKVAAVLSSALIAAPNWAEVLEHIQKSSWRPQAAASRRFKTLGVKVEPVTEDDAEAVARLARATTNRDLSLADRFCLALAERLDLPAYTSDQSWATATTEAKVVMIR